MSFDLTGLIEARAKLLAQFPSDLDPDLDEDLTEVSCAIYRAWGAQLYFALTLDGALIVGADLPGNTFKKRTSADDGIARAALIAAAHQIAQIPESDEWDASHDYGYADATLVGTDTWEDQAGMEEIKKYLRIPKDWYLLKVVNFDHTKLLAMEQWLKDNCQHEYRRVGWSSGCSTKVGVAFSNMNDAFFYKMRWR